MLPSYSTAYRPAAELSEDYSGGPAVLLTEYPAEGSGPSGPELSYLNSATCPDCGAGMVRIGMCFTCPSCGFGGCG